MYMEAKTTNMKSKLTVVCGVTVTAMLVILGHRFVTHHNHTRLIQNAFAKYHSIVVNQPDEVATEFQRTFRPGGSTSSNNYQHTSSESKPKPRVAILTAYFGSALGLRNATRNNKMIYARLNNIHFEDAYQDSAHCKQLIDNITTVAGLALVKDQSTEYSKLLMLKQYILLYYLEIWQGQYDFIFWNDADTLFLNFSKTIDRFLPGDDDETHLVIASGPPGKWERVINTGMFFLRVCAWSQTLVQAVIVHAQQRCDQTIKPFNGWLKLCRKKCCLWGDQGATMRVFQENPSLLRHVRYHGFRDFNSQFPFYSKDDLVVHLSGLATEERISMFQMLSHQRNRSGLERVAPRISTDDIWQDHMANMDYSSLNAQNAPKQNNQNDSKSILTPRNG
eukprot:m.52201 g.52201  ORF g.52201 m.52201 type:complete len:392 (+) comp21562_c0_seq2:223-1398(+)